jgi:hypothetical protein
VTTPEIIAPLYLSLFYYTISFTSLSCSKFLITYFIRQSDSSPFSQKFDCCSFAIPFFILYSAPKLHAHVQSAKVILIEDIQFCFNTHNKTVYYVQNTTIVFDIGIFTMATCFGLSLDRLKEDRNMLP